MVGIGTVIIWCPLAMSIKVLRSVARERPLDSNYNKCLQHPNSDYDM